MFFHQTLSFVFFPQPHSKSLLTDAKENLSPSPPPPTQHTCPCKYPHVPTYTSIPIVAHPNTHTHMLIYNYMYSPNTHRLISIPSTLIHTHPPTYTAHPNIYHTHTHIHPHPHIHSSTPTFTPPHPHTPIHTHTSQHSPPSYFVVRGLCPQSTPWLLWIRISLPRHDMLGEER